LALGERISYLSGDKSKGSRDAGAEEHRRGIRLHEPALYDDVNEAADAVLAFQRRSGPLSLQGQDVNQFKRLVDAGNKGIDVRLREWYPANL